MRFSFFTLSFWSMQFAVCSLQFGVQCTGMLCVQNVMRIACILCMKHKALSLYITHPSTFLNNIAWRRNALNGFEVMPRKILWKILNFHISFFQMLFINCSFRQTFKHSISHFHFDRNSSKIVKNQKNRFESLFYIEYFIDKLCNFLTESHQPERVLYWHESEIAVYKIQTPSYYEPYRHWLFFWTIDDVQ